MTAIGRKQTFPTIQMKKILFASIFIISSCGQNNLPPQEVAENWMELIDAGQYAEAYDELSEYSIFLGKHGSSIRDIPQDRKGWSKYISDERDVHGEFISREYFTHTMGRKNTSNKILLTRGYTFKTKFINTGLVDEVITVVSDKEDHWEVSYYSIRGPMRSSPKPSPQSTPEIIPTK